MERKPIAENIIDANRVGVDMLITDAEIGLTLLALAQTSEVAQDRSRRIDEAHKAYKSILSLLERLNPGAAQLETLQHKMKALAEGLRAADVHVD
jgi:hypothetical protein